MNWIGILIVLFIIGAIMSIIKNIVTKIKVAIYKSSNPEKAVDEAIDAYQDSAMTTGGFESQLIKIAESSNSPEAMRRLAKFYTEDKKDEQKAQYWNKRAIQCGDFETMINYYGFTDYDISYSNYAEILCSLNNVKSSSNEIMYSVNYYKGIAYYKSGDIAQAKQMFISCKEIGAKTESIASKGEYENKCDYMLLLCYFKEKNMDEVTQISLDLAVKKFEIPAKDYLNIYDYWLQQRNEGNPNYLMEILNAEAYGKCKDADRQKSIEMCGDSNYNLAKSYELGINGYDKDIDKAIESYERAAVNGNPEALYYIGFHSWIADNHVRDYNKANYYINRAAKKGHEKAAEFLSKYGVENVLVIPYQAEQKTYRFMDNYQLTVSADSVKCLHICAGAKYNVERISDMFVDAYSKNIKSFDDIIDKVHQLYADHIALMVKWCTSLLMYFGIDSYSARDIIEMCDDLSLLPKVPAFEREIEKIDNRAEALHLQTVYSKATRGYWTGSGFGTTIGSTIKATVNASVAAGVMNIGSGILHGIGDSIVDSMNNSEIKKMGKAVYEKKSTVTEFKNAVEIACTDIGDTVLQILEKDGGIKLSPSEGEIVFGNEALKSINNKALDAKIENNINAKNYEYVYALLLEKLRRNPLDGDTFKSIVTLTAVRHPSQEPDISLVESMIQYSGDFVIDLSAVIEDMQKA